MDSVTPQNELENELTEMNQKLEQIYNASFTPYLVECQILLDAECGTREESVFNQWWDAKGKLEQIRTIVNK